MPTHRHAAGRSSTLRCRLGWVPTVEWAGLYLAEADGHLDAAGLSVELIPGGPGTVGAARAVAEGGADVGIASDLVAVLEVIAEGAPLRLVGATMAASPLGVAWDATRGAPTLDGLVGRRIGAGTPGDQVILDALFRTAGLAPDYTFALIGHDTTELEAGLVDAMCCSTINQPPAAARRGVALTTATFSDLGLPLPADVVVVSDELLRTRRSDVVALLRALVAGWAANDRDPARASLLAAQRYGAAYGFTLADAVDENERQRSFVAASVAAGSHPFAIDVDAVTRSCAALRAAGLVDLPSPAGVVDLGPLREALSTPDPSGAP